MQSIYASIHHKFKLANASSFYGENAKRLNSKLNHVCSFQTSFCAQESTRVDLNHTNKITLKRKYFLNELQSFYHFQTYKIQIQNLTINYGGGFKVSYTNTVSVFCYCC